MMSWLISSSSSSSQTSNPTGKDLHELNQRELIDKIKNGTIDINSINMYKQNGSLLHYSNQYDIIHTLLYNNANPNIYNDRFYTPLTCYHIYMDSANNNNNNNTLYYQRDDYSIMLLLLHYKCNPNNIYIPPPPPQPQLHNNNNTNNANTNNNIPLQNVNAIINTGNYTQYTSLYHVDTNIISILLLLQYRCIPYPALYNIHTSNIYPSSSSLLSSSSSQLLPINQYSALLYHSFQFKQNKTILQQINPLLYNKHGISPYSYAIEYTYLIKLLLDHGSSIYDQNYTIYNPPPLQLRTRTSSLSSITNNSHYNNAITAASASSLLPKLDGRFFFSLHFPMMTLLMILYRAHRLYSILEAYRMKDNNHKNIDNNDINNQTDIVPVNQLATNNINNTTNNNNNNTANNNNNNTIYNIPDSECEPEDQTKYQFTINNTIIPYNIIDHFFDPNRLFAYTAPANPPASPPILHSYNQTLYMRYILQCTDYNDIEPYNIYYSPYYQKESSLPFSAPHTLELINEPYFATKISSINCLLDYKTYDDMYNDNNWISMMNHFKVEIGLPSGLSSEPSSSSSSSMAGGWSVRSLFTSSSRNTPSESHICKPYIDIPLYQYNTQRRNPHHHPLMCEIITSTLTNLHYTMSSALPSGIGTYGVINKSFTIISSYFEKIHQHISFYLQERVEKSNPKSIPPKSPSNNDTNDDGSITKPVPFDDSSYLPHDQRVHLLYYHFIENGGSIGTDNVPNKPLSRYVKHPSVPFTSMNASVSYYGGPIPHILRLLCDNGEMTISKYNSLVRSRDHLPE